MESKFMVMVSRCGAGFRSWCERCGNDTWSCRAETSAGKLCGMCLRGAPDRTPVRMETDYVLWKRIKNGG
jgi:hypothetical protein